MSLNSDGAGVPLDANTKEAEATRNSTPRKDVGAVLPATAARAHNSDTFAFRVCEKQLGPKELSHLVGIHEGRVRAQLPTFSCSFPQLGKCRHITWCPGCQALDLQITGRERLSVFTLVSHRPRAVCGGFDIHVVVAHDHVEAS